MSTTVDNKVVEMRFDNKKFESNVKESLSTLDKLKEKLKLTEASKGLKDVEKSANDIKFDKLEKAADLISKRFSTMGIVGMRVISNLTDSVMGFAKKGADAVKSGIIDGGVKRAKNLENAHFQLQGLLKDEKKVAAVMTDVGDAVDGTAYSLDSAAKVASQLSASGIQAGTGMLTALRGVAGVAAMTNSSYDEIGEIFTKVAGNGKVMTEELRQLSSRGMNAAATLAEQLGKSETEIREMVKKGQIDFATFSKAMDDAFGKHAKDANKTFEGSMSNVKAALGRIGAEFISPLIKENGPLVKLFNTIREKINEVKSVIGPVAKTFRKVVTTTSNVVRKALDKMDFTKPFKVFGQLDSKWDNFASKLKESGIAADEFKKKLKGHQKEMYPDTVKLAKGAKTTRGMYEVLARYRAEKQREYEVTGKSNKELKKNIENMDKLMASVEKGNYSFTKGVKAFKSLEKQGYSYAEVQDVTRKSLNLTNKQFNKIDNALINNDKEYLKNQGYTEREIKILGELQKKSWKTGNSLKSMIENLDHPSGRSLLIDSLRNIVQAVKGLIKPIKEAWNDIFPKKSENTLYNILTAIHNFTERLKMTDERSEKIKNTFKGLFALLDIGRQLIGGVFKAVFGMFGKSADGAGFSILDLTSKLGELIVKFRDFLAEDNKISKFFEMVGSGLSFVVGLFVKLIGFIPQIKDFFVGIFDNVGNPFEAIKDLFKGKDISKNVVDGFANGLFEGTKNIAKAALSIAKTLIDTVKNTLGIHSPSTVFIDIGANIVKGLISGMESLFTLLSKTISTFFNNTVEGVASFGTGSVEVFKDNLSKLKNGLSSVFSFIVNLLSNLTSKIAEGLGKIKDILDENFAAILVIIIGIGLLVILKKLKALVAKVEKIVDPFVGIINNINSVLTNFAKTLKSEAFKLKAEAVYTLVKAIVLLAGALIALAFVPLEQLAKAAGAILVLSTIIGVLYVLVNKVGSNSNSITSMKPITSLIGIVIALQLVVKAFKQVLGAIETSSEGAIIDAFAIISLMAGGLVAIVYIFNKMGDSKNASKGILSALGVAFSILLLVKALQKVASIKLNKLDVSMKVITAFFIYMTAITGLSILAGDKMQKTGLGLLAMSAGILVIAMALKKISKVDSNKISNAIGALFMVFTMFAGIIVISKLSGEHTDSAGKGILAMAGAILVLSLAMKKISRMDSKAINKSLKPIRDLFLMFAGIIAISKLSGQSTDKAGKGILAMAGAVLILSLAMKIVASIDQEKLTKALIAIGILSSIAAVLMIVTGGISANKIMKNAVSIGIIVGVLTVALAALTLLDSKKMLLAAAALSMVTATLALVIYSVSKIGAKNKNATTALLLMSIITTSIGILIYKLAELNTDAALKASAGIALVLASISLAMVSLKKKGTIGKNSLKAIAILGGIVVGLAGMLALLGLTKTEHALEACAGISLILLSIGIVLKLLKNSGSISKTALKAMVWVAAIVAALFALLSLTSKIGDISYSIEVFAGIALLLTTMTGCLWLLNGIKDVSTKAIGQLAIVAGIVSAVFALLSLTSQIGDISYSIEAFAGISVLLSVMTGCLWLLNGLDNVKTKTVLQLAIVAGIVAGLFALLSLTSKIGNISYSIEVFAGMSILLSTMTGCLWLLDGINNVSMKTVGQLAIMAVIVAGLFALLSLTSQIGDISYSIEVFAGVSVLLLSMSASLILLGVVGELGYGAFVGIAALAVLIVAVGALLIGIGALVDTFPQVQTFVEKGGELFEGIGKAIGKFFGGIVAGFTDAVLDVLPKLGLCLSMFMANMVPFFALTKMVPDDLLDVIKRIAGAILVLTAAELINNIASFLGGGNPFELLKEQLVLFGLAMIAFAHTVTGLDFATVLIGANAAKELALAVSQIPSSGGLFGMLFGEKDMATFAKQLPFLGIGVKYFGEHVKGFDKDAVEKGAEAAKILASAASEIPNSGGLWGMIIGNGENKLQRFADQIPGLGLGVKLFARDVTGINLDDVKTGSEAAKELATAVSEIPNSGGLWGWITGNGEDKLQNFAAQIPKLGKGIKSFATEINGVNTTALSTGASAIGYFATVAKIVSDSDTRGFFSKAFLQDSDLEDFAEEIPNLAEGLVGFSENLDGLDVGSLDSSITALSKITGIVKAISTMGDYDSDVFSKWLDGLSSTCINDFVSTLAQFNTDGIKNSISTYIIDPVIATIRSANEDTRSAGRWIVQGLITGITLRAEDLEKAVKTNITDVIKEKIKTEMDIDSPSKKMKEFGVFTTSGFVAGLKKSKKNLEKSVKTNITGATENTIRNELGIHSKSTVGKELGGFTGSGFGSGLSNTVDEVKKGATKLKDAAINTLSGGTTDAKDAGKSVGKNFTEGVKAVTKNGTAIVNGDPIFEIDKTAATNYANQSDKVTQKVSSNNKKIASSSKTAAKTTTLSYESLLKKIKETVESTSSTTYKSAKKNLSSTLGYGKSVVNEFTKAYIPATKNIKNIKNIFGATETAFKNTANYLYKQSSYYSEDKKTLKKYKEDLTKYEDQVTKYTKKRNSLRSKDAKKNKKSIASYTEKIQEAQKKVNETNTKISKHNETVAKHTAKAFKDMQKSIAKSIRETYKLTSLSLDTGIDLFEEFVDPDKTQEKIDDLTSRKNNLEAQIAENMTKNTIESKEANKELREELEKVNKELDEEQSKMDEFDKVTKDSILSNMQSQIDGVSKMYSDYGELSGKGLSEGLLEHIKSMGTDGIKYIRAFLNMSDEEIQKANTMFDQTKSLSGTAMSNALQSNISKAKRWAKGIQDLAGKGYLSQKMMKQLIDAGPDSLDYVEALLAMSDEDLKSFASSYKSAYKAAGEDLSDEVMSGYVRAGAEGVKGFTSALEDIATEGTKANDKVKSNAKTVATAITDVLEYYTKNGGKDAVDKLKTELSKTKGKKISKNITDGLSSGFVKQGKKVNKTAEDLAGDIITTVKNKLDINSPSKKFDKIGVNTLKGLINGLSDSTQIEKLQKTVANIVGYLTYGIVDTYDDKGFLTGKGIATKVEDAATNMLTKLASITISKDLEKKLKASGTKIGDYIVDGLTLGLIPSTETIGKDHGSKKVDTVVKKSEALAALIIEAVRKKLDEHSPSKVFYKIGEFIDQGLINGMGSGEKLLNDNATNIMSGVIDTVNDIIENSSDYDPVITPVLDLSEIQNGASNINGIIGENRMVSLKYVDSMVNDVNRCHSSNDLVLNAINKLQNTLESKNERPNITQNNEFNINSNGDAREIADEVSHILQQEIERRNAVWA